PALWWLGLSSVAPRSNDYVPMFPWFGAVLAGIGAARLAISCSLMERLRRLPVHRRLQPLVLAGQHSLAFYLIHQPVLIACIWLFSQVVPAAALSPQESFLSSCTASWQQSREAA